jgi:tRNA pseudouridine55 synthase
VSTTSSRPAQAHGVLILNKPSGPTSTHCLEKIKRTLGQKKIGHAGTLDPLAQGVLLVLLGQATKIAGYLTAERKFYSGVLRLGVETDTYDVLGKTLRSTECVDLSPDLIREEVQAWLSLEEQDVPPYSAAKHHGRPLYALSRAGQDVPVKRKPIHIYQAEIMRIDLPLVSFRVECSAGTYIRSLVHSLGKRLQCGAVLTQLIRERSHPFAIDQAHELDDVLGEPEILGRRVLPIPQALPHLPRLSLPRQLERSVRNGVRLPWETVAQSLAPQPDSLCEEAGSKALFLDLAGNPLALVELRNMDGRLYWNVLRGLF